MCKKLVRIYIYIYIEQKEEEKSPSFKEVLKSPRQDYLTDPIVVLKPAIMQPIQLIPQSSPQPQKQSLVSNDVDHIL